MNFNQMIPSIVENLLPRFSQKDKGLMLSFDLRDNDYGYAEDGNTIERKEKSASTVVRLLFQRPNNYTKVMVQYKFNNWQRDIKDPYIEDVEFKHLSDHDSCWRDGCTRWTYDHWNSLEGYFGCHPRERQLSRFYSFNMSDPGCGIQLVRFDKLEHVIDTECHNDTIGYSVRLSRWEDKEKERRINNK